MGLGLKTNHTDVDVSESHVSNKPATPNIPGVAGIIL